MVMINTPNKLGRMTSLVASYTTFSLSLSGRVAPFCFWDSDNRLIQFSTMITAPSTIKPKSSAPKLIKLADTSVLTMPDIVASIAKGITAAVISAARTFPSKTNSTTMTSKAPSTRFFCTVSMVLSTRLVLS